MSLGTTHLGFPTDYQAFIYMSRYSRYIWNEGRREYWGETVKRYLDFFQVHLGETCGYSLTKDLRSEIEEAILHLQVMPSMRCLMTAGDALEREPLAGYNCSYTEISRPQAFDEILYVLLSGTGAGFSVERDKISNLPTVAEEFHQSDTVIVVGDSKLGWAKAFKELIGMLYQGQIPRWDLTKIRPAGAPLKTFGGRASGPGPLQSLFHFAVVTFKNAAGRKLNSLECHDLVCKTGEVVIVGGVRRSALISLSNVSDDRMRHAKSGQWWIEHPERTLSNNSAAYTERPDVGVFMDEWHALYASKSGERGIFNRVAAQNQVAKYGRRDTSHAMGTNPCGEILLRDRGLCNLSEAIVRVDDTLETLEKKVRLASILGTFQSTLTNFKYMSAKWNHNSEEERLLGVSLTGIMDSTLLNGNDIKKTQSILTSLRELAVATNVEFAKKLKINPSVAVTCVKPSGTVSQMTDSASGIHARHSQYYIRTVRMDKKDPLNTLMIAQGVPHEDDVTNPSNITVFSFPMQSPKGAILRTDRSAVEQLEFWQLYHDYWCEHNPSITVSVKEHEWLDVGAWVYKHFDKVCGVAFLPYSEHIYKQAPYQECTQEHYQAAAKAFPETLDWDKLIEYDGGVDMTTGSQELACSAGKCDL